MNRIKLFLYIFFLFNFSDSFALNEKWVGEWIATDEWQSEYIITLKKSGIAISNYANGEKGKWTIVDSNIEILWDSGKSDFLFNGVMGMQRLHKSKDKSYTSGIQKVK